MRKNTSKNSASKNKKYVFACLALVTLFIAGIALFQILNKSESSETNSQKINSEVERDLAAQNPLTGVAFYRDSDQEIIKLAESYRNNQRLEEARLLEKISNQPSAIWLVGPNSGDLTAQKDIRQVERTSGEAASLQTTPIYHLYAIPNRDACAEYSNGGFQNSSDYLNWINNIVASLKTKSIFVVEADAIAHATQGGCLSSAQTNERYELIKETIAVLNQSPEVIGVYLDSGHSEWFPDPSVLVEPLTKAGIKNASGIAVNVSNYVATPDITAWSEQLVGSIGGGKGVIIDTSRNGKGSVSSSVSGDARWCNPKGRGLGRAPTTDTGHRSVHAYYWGKKPGESDGACFGYPAAGVLVPELAIELARNAEN